MESNLTGYKLFRDRVYIDVACRYCGRSGCLGVLDRIEEDVQW